MTDQKTQEASNPLMKVDGNHITVVDGIKKHLGTKNIDFANGIINQLVNIGSKGPEIDEKGTAFVTAVVTGIEPKDQIETMLATQMAAIHNATMTFARRLAHVENIAQQDSASRALNQLARTFTAQVDALKRHRTGGQQHVTVKHVTVNEGGQAIVGNVSTGGRDGNGN
ncbi:MAG: hypothetical protein EWV88_06740 [Microcystis wesenbergii Mw_MB_S_20031200_S109D]|uniref:Uncharacterized protein n=1 Tax=Microcystis wesenbergii Mw_MB_S_20031200_S109D TaxID=2486241 RepID=A0A552M135_9CHRO|nr:MAG: hypothetical protein EWV88_06740 [Microcystis wesenbergii Mw_MB_S_20031200_S109D]